MWIHDLSARYEGRTSAWICKGCGSTVWSIGMPEDRGEAVRPVGLPDLGVPIPSDCDEVVRLRDVSGVMDS
jgi:hypothetical protein